jgi:predicted TIM-barrel fold metal-dependent hydrolase
MSTDGRERRGKPVDGFVTPVFWSDEDAPDYVRDVARSLFHRPPAEVFRSRTPDELVGEMEVAGIGRAVLNALPGSADRVAEFPRAHPGRFALAAEVDPLGGMRTVREVERLVTELGARVIRVIPFKVGLPPDHAVYFPVYAKCAELEVPVSMTTGMPGPPVPAEVQRPIHLDPVLRFFPELDVVMAHGADPWWDEAIRLMVKFPRLSMLTSDCAPQYLPPSLIHFINTRGRAQVMFATGFPMLTFERCLREAMELDLRPDAREAFLHANADRLFFDPPPRQGETT